MIGRHGSRLPQLLQKLLEFFGFQVLIDRALVFDPFFPYLVPFLVVPVTGLVPFAFRLIDVIEIFLLAAFTELVWDPDKLVFALFAFRRVRTNLCPATLALESALCALENLLNSLNFPFPLQSVLFFFANLQLIVQ